MKTIKTFREYIFKFVDSNPKQPFGENKCHYCDGDGKMYDPNDPRDPYEGNKLRRVIDCIACNKTGINPASKIHWKNKYKKHNELIKKDIREAKEKKAMINSIVLKLNKKQKAFLKDRYNLVHVV